MSDDVYTAAPSGSEGENNSTGSWNWMMFGVTGIVCVAIIAVIRPTISRQI